MVFRLGVNNWGGSFKPNCCLSFSICSALLAISGDTIYVNGSAGVKSSAMNTKKLIINNIGIMNNTFFRIYFFILISPEKTRVRDT
ncbi:Uncharacterised protein [Streptococcus pneumoniae]|nr:Uncharacterised protein [Streptococcus pneumoniae]